MQPVPSTQEFNGWNDDTTVQIMRRESYRLYSIMLPVQYFWYVAQALVEALRQNIYSETMYLLITCLNMI